MSTTVRDLQAKKAATVEAARALMSVAESADRDFSAEEKTQYDAMSATIQSLNSRIERAQAQDLAEAGLSASNPQAAPANRTANVVATSVIGAVTENVEKDPKAGFKSFGEYAQKVRAAGMSQRTGQAMDSRLLPLAVAPSTFAGEGTGADGGILVPPGFSKDIFTLSLMEDALLPLTDDMPVEGNNMMIPKDETTPWGSTGVRAYWQAEASVAVPTKPVLGALDLRLKKLMALIPVSDELLADTTALTAYLPTKVAMSIRWKTNEAILFGSGAGVPSGAFSLTAPSGVPSLVQVKDTNQATLTLSTANLLNMFSRLPPGSFGKAIWMINNSVIPALGTLTLGNYPIFLPMNGQGGSLSGSFQWTLLGRPVVISQHAKAFSSAGDVMLMDLSYYQTITKAEGVQTATSMHLYFDADAMAFRTTFRMDGMPKIAAPISPANGNVTLSPFVSLGAR